MPNEKSEKKNRFIKGLAAGAAVGAVAAALLTPKTGKKTIRIVKDALRKAKTKGEKIIKVTREAARTGEQLYEKAVPKVKKVVTNIKTAVKKVQ